MEFVMLFFSAIIIVCIVGNKLSARRRHYKYYTERNWGESLNYDLCINTATCGIDEAAEIIAKLAGK